MYKCGISTKPQLVLSLEFPTISIISSECGIFTKPQCISVIKPPISHGIPRWFSRCFASSGRSDPAASSSSCELSRAWEVWNFPWGFSNERSEFPMGCSEMRSEIPNESEVLIYFKWIFRIFQVKIGYINV